MLAEAFLGALFLSSAWAKLRNRARFGEIAREYPLPAWIHPEWVAKGAPGAEIALAVTLLSPIAWLSPVPALAAALFLVMVSSAAALRFARGEREFLCGCDGDLDKPAKAGWLLVRNAVFIALALAGLWPGARVAPEFRELAPVYLTGFGLVLALKLARAARIGFAADKEWKATG